MSIKIKTDLEFGSVWYIKNDPDQLPHLLVGIIIVPGNQFIFRLDFMGDVVELYDFECSSIVNPDVLQEEDMEDD
jgi:hypothetical protein